MGWREKVGTIVLHAQISITENSGSAKVGPLLRFVYRGLRLHLQQHLPYLASCHHSQLLGTTEHYGAIKAGNRDLDKTDS